MTSPAADAVAGTRAARPAHVRIGCSGWEYRHWKGRFYPDALPRACWFRHYARTFGTVEINNSFYRLPPQSTMKRWRLQAPPGFIYAVKASRYLTHMKKLKDPEGPLDLLLGRARELGPHLGPVLYQLPPRWRPDHARLEAFLRALPPDVRHTIEFREAAWYSDATFDLLTRYRAALCVHDMTGSAAPPLAIGPFVYVRLHGATAKYAGSYSDEQLDRWASWIAEQRQRGLDAYVYFNNDAGGHAPKNALTLVRMVDPWNPRNPRCGSSPPSPSAASAWRSSRRGPRAGRARSTSAAAPS